MPISALLNEYRAPIERILRSRILGWMLFAAVLLLAAKRALPLFGGWMNADSWGAMTAALDYLEDHSSDTLYDELFFRIGVQYQYPPSALLLIEPFHAAGIATRRVLNSVNFVLYLLNAAVLSTLAVRLAGNLPRLVIRWGVFLLAMLFDPIPQAYHLGQIQIVSDLLFSLVCLLLVIGLERYSGAVLGLAVAVKPQLGLLLLLEAVHRRWNFIVGFVASLSVVGLASLLAFGWYCHVSYLSVLSFLAERGAAHIDNASVNGIVNRLLENGSVLGVEETRGAAGPIFPPYHPVVATATRIAAALFMAVPFVVAFVTHRRADNILLIFLGAVCFTMASPLVWMHHYAIFLPIYMILFQRMLVADRNLTSVALLVVSFLLVGAKYPDRGVVAGWPIPLQSATLVFVGGCMLMVLLLLEVRRSSRADPADPVGLGALAPVRAT